VFTVNVAVTGCVPEIVTGCVTEQVGTLAAPEGLDVIAHDNATPPVKPPLGVTVTVDVPLIPGDVMLTAVPLSEKSAAGAEPVTVTLTLVV
jgi:hypothetical protein